MNCCCFRVSSPPAKPPTPPINASGKPPYLAVNRLLSSLLPERPTEFASRSSLPLRIHAFPGDCLTLQEVSADAVSTSRTPDPSVLLQTSVLLLSLYVVANFVVPSYVSKFLGLVKAGDEDSNRLDEDKRSSSCNSTR